MKILTMPTEVNYSKSWSLSEAFGTMSYTRQFFEDIFRIKIKVQGYYRIEDPEIEYPTFNGRNMTNDFIQAFNPRRGPPVEIYFVEDLHNLQGIRGAYTYTDSVGGASFPGFNIVLVVRAILKRYGRHNSLEFARTVGHEIGHVLKQGHLKSPLQTPNIMASIGTVGKRPRYVATDPQINEARKFGLKVGYLKPPKS